jgi:hypothetical protein
MTSHSEMSDYRAQSKAFVLGQTSALSTLSSRILTTANCCAAVVLLAGFSASFVSYMTVRRPVIPFNTFSELLERGTYRLGVLPDSSTLPYFQVCMPCGSTN